MRKKYSIFSKEKIGAALLMAVVLVLIGMIIGSYCHSEEQLAKAWVMCRPMPGNRVEVRKEARKDSESVGFLECGDWFYTDGDSKDGWIRCIGIGEYDEGWIYSGYVSTNKPEIVMERYVCVAIRQVACRRWMGGPQMDGRAAWLKNGQFVTVFVTDGEWCVTDRGYIRAEWLEVSVE